MFTYIAIAVGFFLFGMALMAVLAAIAHQELEVALNREKAANRLLQANYDDLLAHCVGDLNAQLARISVTGQSAKKGRVQ